jgi:hypothetical protein
MSCPILRISSLTVLARPLVGCSSGLGDWPTRGGAGQLRDCSPTSRLNSAFWSRKEVCWRACENFIACFDTTCIIMSCHFVVSRAQSVTGRKFIHSIAHSSAGGCHHRPRPALTFSLTSASNKRSRFPPNDAHVCSTGVMRWNCIN